MPHRELWGQSRKNPLWFSSHHPVVALSSACIRSEHCTLRSPGFLQFRLRQVTSLVQYNGHWMDHLHLIPPRLFSSMPNFLQSASTWPSCNRSPTNALSDFYHFGLWTRHQVVNDLWEVKLHGKHITFGNLWHFLSPSAMNVWCRLARYSHNTAQSGLNFERPSCVFVPIASGWIGGKQCSALGARFPLPLPHKQQKRSIKMSSTAMH